MNTPGVLFKKEKETSRRNKCVFYEPNAETLFEDTFEFPSAITYTLENLKLYMMEAMLLHNDKIVDYIIEL